MKAVSSSYARDHFCALVREVQEMGEPVSITLRGRPMVCIEPLDEPGELEGDVPKKAADR